MNHALFKYESTDSVAFLASPSGRSSSTAPSPLQTPQASFHRGDASDRAYPLTVALSIRVGRLVLLTVSTVGGILGLMIVLTQGVEVKRFQSSAYDKAAQQKLLDDYNSYSGNVSSAFGKPIELLVPLLVQIFMLRFMAKAFTQPETTFKQQALTLALSAGVGYLITNGFNAVNVQLRPQDVISASDLAVGSDLNETMAAATTTVSKTVSELTPGNLITNTVLRNAMLPRVALKEGFCDWILTRVEKPVAIPLPTVNYGFAQRDWQKQLLQRALKPQTLRVVVNATDEYTNKAVRAADLPMNASTAADLLLYALAMGPNMRSWGLVGDFVNKTDFTKRFPTSSPLNKDPTYVDSTARRLALLPSSTDADETTQREWFLKELPRAVARQFNNSANTTRTDIGVELSRVAITPEITFEAVTFEVDLDPKLVATNFTNNSTTRLTEVYQACEPGLRSNCGPWPALCFVAKQPYTRESTTDYETDTLQQVQAFGSCMNANRTLELWTNSFTSMSFDCNNVSDSSMMIMSIGKRLVATSFEQNKSDSGTSKYPTTVALVTNLRKVYTFTIGRLSWQLQDLSTTFHARCGVNTTESKCMGLQVPLSTSSVSDNGLVVGGEASAQRLIVSADVLPTKLPQLSNIPLFDGLRAIALVEVSESPYRDIVAGDVLLPHNAGKITWANTTVSGRRCDADIEAHLFTRLNNHLYIEHSFQVAYTASTFFLLQNGVVKDAIAKSGSQEVTLRFDNDLQDVVVWVSTPYQNAVLSIVGCVILVLGLVAPALKAALGSSKDTDPLAVVSTPQAIARVMLDDRVFPSFLLGRRIVDEGETPQPRKIEEFTIAGVTVEHTDDHQRFAASQ